MSTLWKWLSHLGKASGTEGALTSLGVMGPVVAFVIMMVNSWWGEELISVAEVEVHANAVIAVVGFVMGIWGRIRATKKIGGGSLK